MNAIILDGINQLFRVCNCDHVNEIYMQHRSVGDIVNYIRTAPSFFRFRNAHPRTQLQSTIIDGNLIIYANVSGPSSAAFFIPPTSFHTMAQRFDPIRVVYAVIFQLDADSNLSNITIKTVNTLGQYNTLLKGRDTFQINISPINERET